MTIEILEQRLKIIEEQMKQLISNFNMLEGGKAECLHWIEELKKTKAAVSTES